MLRMIILTKYHLISMWNWRSVYYGRLIEPVAYLSFLVVGISGMIASEYNADYAFYALTGIYCILTFRIFNSSVSDVSNDRKWGVCAIFNMQGGSYRAYLFSIIAVGVIVLTAQLILLNILFYFISGMGSFNDLLPKMLFSSLISMLVAQGWAGFGAALGALVNSYSTRDLISTLTSLPLILSAPLFYSLETAPKYLIVIAKLNPLTYHVEWIRHPTLYHFILSIVWLITCFEIGAYGLRKSDRVSSER